MQEGSEDFCENGRESEKFNEKRENRWGNEGKLEKQHGVSMEPKQICQASLIRHWVGDDLKW